MSNIGFDYVCTSCGKNFSCDEGDLQEINRIENDELLECKGCREEICKECASKGCNICKEKTDWEKVKELIKHNTRIEHDCLMKLNPVWLDTRTENKESLP